MIRSFFMALDSIWHNKVRAFLTMLGVIIGVAAVIILVSVTDGVTGMITDIFEEFGTNTIQVSVTSRGNTRRIDPEQIYELKDKYKEYFEFVSPSVSMSGTLKTDVDNIKGSITGVNEQFQDIKLFTLTEGRFLTYADVDKMLPVCVIGSYIKDELFPGQSPIGKTMKINGFRYEIVGLLEETGGSSVASSDNIVYIPYTNARKILKSDVVSSYVFSLTNEDYANLGVSVIENFAEDILGDSDYVSVLSMKQIMESFDKIMNAMRLFLVLIAGISLLVGGIGIMNIMLVSVTERTKEIGIRKSLGAKDWDVLSQFIIEAGSISSIGGIIGIILGVSVSLLIGHLMNIAVAPGVSAIGLSFGVSFAIGVIFGFLPARKAAKLNPIDALRFD